MRDVTREDQIKLAVEVSNSLGVPISQELQEMYNAQLQDDTTYTRFNRCEEQFSVGDVVALPSGGPAMTVSSVEAGGKHVAAEWFNNDGELLRCSFNIDALIEAPQECDDDEDGDDEDE